MKKQNEHYKQYRNLINKRSQHYAKKWNVEFEEVQGKALEIYCKCLTSHDEEKGAFSTHLHSQLQALNYYCKILAYHNAIPPIEEVPAECLFVKDTQNCILQESIQTELSTIAQEIVSRVIDGTLLCVEPYKRLFSITTITDNYGVDFYTAQNVMEEIKNWWNKFYSEV